MRKSIFIRQYYPSLLFGSLVFCCLLLGLLPSLQIIIERNLIDSAIAEVATSSSRIFVTYLIQFIVLILSSSLLTSLLKYGTDSINRIVGKKLDIQRVEKCNKVSFAITESQSFHDLCEKAVKAPEHNQAFLASLQTVTRSMVQIIASFVVLYSIDTRTAVIIYILLLLGIWINKKAANDSGDFWGEYIKNMRRANYYSSLLLNREYAMERKTFNYNPEIESRYHASSDVAIKKNSKLGRKRFVSESITTLFAAIYSMVAILLLIPPIVSNKITIGAFIAAFTAISSLRNVASKLYEGIYDGVKNYSLLSGFFSLLNLEEERSSVSSEKIDLSKGIEFQNVSFTYPGSSDAVLDDVSFTLNVGMHYALVGENGCGKTTLVKLLLGLYKPSSGRILVGGKEASEMNNNEKRHVFSAIFQDFYRYPISIRENVSLSSEKNLDSDTINDVLDKIHFDVPLRLKENGLDISLGILKQESADLSGGEWQKLAIARSMLSEAQIIVLDEPNAALDPISEMEFYRVYEEIFKSRTTLFISHRLGAVKSADKILVLHNNRLIAKGSHDALMKRCEYYRELFETQRGLYYEN